MRKKRVKEVVRTGINLHTVLILSKVEASLWQCEPLLINLCAQKITLLKKLRHFS